MTSDTFLSRLRGQGQVTIPSEVREMLDLREGDDLLFFVNEQGQIVIDPQISVPAGQAWFWTQRWQRMEREAQADIEVGRVSRYVDVDEALNALDQQVESSDRDN